MFSWEEKLAEGKSIIAKAEREDRDLTKAESERCDKLIKSAGALKRDENLAKHIDELAGSAYRPGRVRPRGSRRS